MRFGDSGVSFGCCSKLRTELLLGESELLKHSIDAVVFGGKSLLANLHAKLEIFDGILQGATRVVQALDGGGNCSVGCVCEFTQGFSDFGGKAIGDCALKQLND